MVRDYDLDIERIAETIDNLDIFNEIQDKDSFDLAYDDYLGDSTLTKKEDFRENVFKKLKNKHPQRIVDERIFTKAGGKFLRQDKRQTAKTIVTTKTEYIKKGSRKVDLKGYDTKAKKKKVKRKLNIVGKVKEKIVYSSKEYIFVRGVSRIRYRDRLGRFVSVRRR